MSTDSIPGVTQGDPNGQMGAMPQAPQQGLTITNPLIRPGMSDIQLGKVLVEGKELVLINLITESAAVTAMIPAEQADAWADALKFVARQVRTGLIIPQGSNLNPLPNLNGA